MYFKMIAAGLALIAGASIAMAADDEMPAGEGMIMSYEVFENTVPHADLEACPDEFADQAVFCRLTIAHDRLNVIVFSEEDDQPMVAVRQVDLDKTEFAY